MMKKEDVPMLENVMDRFRLDGKKAFVTGAAGTIGSKTAEALAMAGADVAIVDHPVMRDKAQAVADAIAEKWKVNTMAVCCDVTDPDQVQQMIDTICEQFGTIDIVHNNAGITNVSAQDVDSDPARWHKVIDVNLFGVYVIARAAAQRMIKDGHGGSIINTASMSATIANRPYPGTPQSGSAYCASKAGVLLFTKSFALQVIRHGIRVNCISPGYIPSNLHVGMPQTSFDNMVMTTPIGRTAIPEELQGAIVFLASDASSFCVGTDLIIDGGHTCW